MKFFILIIFLNINLLAYSKIIDTKIHNNITYNIIETKAKVMNNFTEGDNRSSISMIFHNRKNQIAVSQVFYDTHKFKIDDSVKIYYLENTTKSQQFFDVFFNKNDIKLPLEVKSKTIVKKITTNKIPTNTCHSFYSGSPLYFLETLEDNKGYQYAFNTSMVYTFIKIVLLVFIIFSIIKMSIGSGIVALVIFIGLSVFQTHMKAEKLVFDTEKNAFYKKYEGEDNSLEIVKYTAFREITALQVLTYEECTTDSEDYEYCVEAYELNLVLNDNKRINLEAHTYYDVIAQHVNILENLLKIEVLYHEE